MTKQDMQIWTACDSEHGSVKVPSAIFTIQSHKLSRTLFCKVPSANVFISYRLQRNKGRSGVM